jgi:serine/threonine-protein kinase HipA
MAINLYGTVYFQDAVAGTLQQVPDGRYAFTYDRTYLESGQPQIAYTLPRTVAAQYSPGLPAFFDNLVTEGWLARAQARALGIAPEDRFARLLAFGRDCPGAVSLGDPRPASEPNLEQGTTEEIAALTNRASISGVQPKLFVIRDGEAFRPAHIGERTTHIAKLPSGELADIVEIEYLSTLAASALLPEDQMVEVEVASIRGIDGRSLVVRRFDRPAAGGMIHFEEFNQLFGRSSEAKYEGSYGEMAKFILAKQTTQREQDVDRLFRRVLVCILLGNNDAHAKNFGLLHTEQGFRLAPFYDVVAAALYDRFKAAPLALKIGAGPNPGTLSGITDKHLGILAESFGLTKAALALAVADLKRRLPTATRTIDKASAGTAALKEKLKTFVGKRWNGTFESIGKQ